MPASDPLAALAGSFVVDSSLPYSSGPVEIINASLENPRLSLDDPATWDDVMGGSMTSAGLRITPQQAIGQPAIWRAINLLVNDVAKLPLAPYRRAANDGREKATEHPSYRLTRRKANPLMTAFNFRRTLTYHALMHGNGLAAIWRDRRGAPDELLVLNPCGTTYEVIDGQLWYLTKIGSVDVAIHSDDVLHIMGLSHDGLWGLNVAEVFAEAFSLTVAARKFGTKFFGEGTNASGVLMVPGHFSEEKGKNTLKAWNEMQKGLNNAHRVALLQDGAKFEKLTIPPEAAQFLQTRQFEIREIANVFGVPAHKLGDDTKTSHNSLEAENSSYIDESLDPWLTQWETQCEIKLLTEQEQASDSHFFEFNRNARLRTDAKTRSEVYRILRELGVLSANDILRRENMPTIGKVGDKLFRPSNWLPLDDEGPTKTPPTAPPEARAKLKACLVDRLERLQRIEAKRWEQHDYQTGEWAQKFYAGFYEQMSDALLPVVEAAWAVLDPLGNPLDCLGDFLDRWINGSEPVKQRIANRDTLAEQLLPPIGDSDETEE